MDIILSSFGHDFNAILTSLGLHLDIMWTSFQRAEIVACGGLSSSRDCGPRGPRERISRPQIDTAHRADSFGTDGFWRRALSTESALGFSSAKAYPRRASVGRRGCAREATADYTCNDAKRKRSVAVAAVISAYPPLRLLRQGKLPQPIHVKARRERETSPSPR